MRWDEATGAVSVFRKPSSFSNGNSRDRQGRLVTCEHDTRRVTRTEYDGTITVVLDRFDGKPLNSPTSHFYHNIENRQPVQIITSLPEMLDAFETIDELAGKERLVVAGRDPAVVTRFKEEKPGVVKIA
jgi:hypothetical protein